MHHQKVKELKKKAKDNVKSVKSHDDVKPKHSKKDHTKSEKHHEDKNQAVNADNVD